jgi:hypothetical protein
MNWKDDLLRQYKDLDLPNDGEEYAGKMPSSSKLGYYSVFP